MTSKADIIEALQFTSLFPFDAINTTGSSRETITWQYAGTSEPVDFVGGSYTGWTAFDAAEKAAFDAALAHIETFLNVEFVEVTGSADPDLNVGKVTIPGSTAGVGGLSFSGFGTTISTVDSYVVYDNTLDLSLDAQTNLLLHELGHSLGLKHPFSDTPNLPAGEDNNKYTVMSYTDNPDNGERSDAMMLYDMLALQDIWGSVGYLTGDTSYTGSRTDTVDTIWDTGGTDVFDASARTGAVALDLREGRFSTFGTYEDVSIAYGTKIENAKGGSGDDTIRGNGLANVLKGQGGDDTLYGGNKGDTLAGGKGKDMMFGEKGKDTLKGGGGKDTLKGGSGDDTLNGEKGNDKLKGGKGDDTLKGKAGNDKLWGDGGADRFVFEDGGGDDIIKDFKNDVDEIKIIGLGSKSAILAKAEDVGADVVIDFGTGDSLTILGTSVAEITDDILT